VVEGLPTSGKRLYPVWGVVLVALFGALALVGWLVVLLVWSIATDTSHSEGLAAGMAAVVLPDVLVVAGGLTAVALFLVAFVVRSRVTKVVGLLLGFVMVFVPLVIVATVLPQDPF
jgi:hypothetical protein